LPPGRRQAVAAALERCQVCRQELDQLAAMLSAMRRLPNGPAPRSFVFAAPPAPAPVARASLFLGAPRWVYAGAVSVAAVLLAAVVSADLTGSLVPQDHAPAMRSFQAAPAPGELAPQETAVPDAGQTQGLMKSAEPGSNGPEPVESPQPEPGIAVPLAPPAQGTPPSSEALETAPPGLTPAPAQETAMNAAAWADEYPSVAEGQATTPLMWRVLEGLLALAALAGLTALAFKMRRERR